MSDYVTTTQLAAFSQELAALSSDGQTLLVTAASRLFDNLCEVPENFFAKAGATETNRDFYGDGTAYLKVDPFVSLNAINPVVMETSDVPAYSVIDRQLIVIGNTLRQSATAQSSATRFEGWPLGEKVTISAKWGWSDIPADVQLAVIALAMSQWRTADPSNAVISSAEGAFTKINSIADVHKNTIDKYRAKYSRAALFA